MSETPTLRDVIIGGLVSIWTARRLAAPIREFAGAAQELAKWADTYKAVTGEPLAFIHADLSWTEGADRAAAAQHNATAIAAVAQEILFMIASSSCRCWY